MQKKHTKGLFIDSSCRRAGLLKTLLRGFRHEWEGEDAGEENRGRDDRTFSSPGRMGFRSENDNTHTKKAASL